MRIVEMLILLPISYNLLHGCFLGFFVFTDIVLRAVDKIRDACYNIFRHKI
jgi:hypothetical protein